MAENFNPHDPKYKKISDLPPELQGNFVNAGDGFVRKEVAQNESRRNVKAKEINKQRPILDKLLGRNRTTSMDVAFDEAQKDNTEFNRRKTHDIARSGLPEKQPVLLVDETVKIDEEKKRKRQGIERERN